MDVYEEGLSKDFLMSARRLGDLDDYADNLVDFWLLYALRSSSRDNVYG